MSEKLNQAITVIKAGDKQTGRQLLIEILKSEPHNENAWLWMTQVVSKKDEKIKCLEQVLKINPDNEIAQKGIARLRPIESPGLDDIAPKTNTTPVIQRKKQERTESTIRRLEKAEKPRATSRPTDQQLIQQYIAQRTRQGWQVVNQTDTSVQMRKPKRWSTALLVLGGAFLIFFGVGLIFWILAVIDYAIKKEQTIFVTADELREGTEKKPASSMKGPLILAGILIGGFILCVAFSLFPAILITPTGNTPSSSNRAATSTPQPVPTPTAKMAPTSTGPFNTPDDMVKGIVGDRLDRYDISNIQDLNGPEWEDDGGLFIDVYLKDPHSISRSELLSMAYALQYAAHKQNLSYLSLILFTSDERCSLGIGVGRNATSEFLPDSMPSNIEEWFQKLVKSQYYADRPGENIYLTAYANDTRKPACRDYPEWQ